MIRKRRFCGIAKQRSRDILLGQILLGVAITMELESNVIREKAVAWYRKAAEQGHPSG